MKKLFILTFAVLFSLNLLAQEKKEAVTLIKNVNIFDGKNERLIPGSDVMIEGNMIKEIGKNLSFQGATVIDAQGKTLIPGLTDCHTHIMWNADIEELIYSAPEGYVGALAALNAENMLMRGFTTVRDMGGPSHGLKKAIDEGAIPGPRILPTGAFVSQSSGHGDYDSRMFYLSNHFTGQIDKAYIRGWTIIADGVPEVQKATREILRAGASQIKIFGSGSITGAHDPLDVTEYTIEELKAIVKEAEHWGTYAAIHAYSSESIMNALEAGVQSIEHGLFASEEAFQLMKEKDAFFSTQFLAFSLTPEEAGMKGPAVPKYLEAQAGAAKGYELAKKIGVKMTWGTDILGSYELAKLQNQEFVARSKYFSGFEILKQATSNNAELFERSGKRHPYQEGPLGVITEGAYADLLLIDGNPLEDIKLLADHEKNIQLIMKDGIVYKNTLGK
ncbi:metal-dependent hydrolase family protein [Gaetbulibacter saemankumensis]|uniref:metal-dependent hydrolase family protein n=1 Tax=Gaetbulibacter saemankumensis TaxID=311208 RepID=UPI000482576A|nr:amidohydrolase family protein [Gaetbulibacter saemankumensis]